MQAIKDNKSLAEAIAHLEAVRKSEGNLLHEHFKYTVHELNPINIVKEKFNSLFTSPTLRNEAVQAGIGLAGGLLTNKLIVGASGGFIRKALGMVAQAGITKMTIKDPEAIKESGASLLQSWLTKLKIK